MDEFEVIESRLNELSQSELNDIVRPDLLTYNRLKWHEGNRQFMIHLNKRESIRSIHAWKCIKKFVDYERIN